MKLSHFVSIPLVALLLLAYRGVAIPNPQQEEDPVAEAIERLQDPDPGERRQAAEALMVRRQGAAPAIPALTVACSDTSPEVRLAAVEALHAIQTEPEKRMPPLVRSLGDVDPRVREAAVAALCSIAWLSKPACLEAVEDPGKRSAALMALARMSDGASEELEALFERVACAPGILRAWALVGTPKVEKILSGFERPALEEATWEALALVAWTYPLLPGEVPDAVRKIDDPARRRMVYCLLTGGRFGESVTVENVNDFLGSEHAILRRMGARALGLAPRVVPGSVDLLLPMLGDGDEDVLAQVFWALHRQDTRPTPMQDYFERMLSEKVVQEPPSRREVTEPEVRYGGRYGSETTRWDRLAYHYSKPGDWYPVKPRDPVLPDLQRTTEWLAPSLRSESHRVWFAALWTVYRFAPLEPATLELLATVFDHGAPEARKLAAKLATDLAWAGLKGWSGHAHGLLGDPEPQVRELATKLLLMDVHPGGRDLLVECLGQGDEPVRVGAVEMLLTREDAGDPCYADALRCAFEAGTLKAGAALVQQGPDATLIYVELLCDEATDVEIRGMCIACLGELGAEARATLPLLRTLLRHEDPRIRKSTRRAMKRIKDDEEER